VQTPAVAIIGTGTFARNVVLPALRAVSARMVGAYDISPANLRTAAQEFGIEKLYASVEEVLADQQVELVCLHTNSDSHAGLLAKVIASGRPFLCEKPAALGSKQVAAAGEAARRAGLIHAVNHEFRYAPPYRRIRELVQAGYVGELRFVSCSTMTSLALNPAFASHYCDGKSLFDSGGGFLPQSLSHHIDLMQYMCGNATFTAAQCATTLPEKPIPSTFPLGTQDKALMGRIDTEDAVAIGGRLANGAPVALAAAWTVHHGSGSRWEIYGSEGTLLYHAGLSMWGPGDPLLGARKDNTEFESLDLGPPLPTGPLWTNLQSLVAEELRDLMRAIRGEPNQQCFATLESELNVWTNIERARGRAVPQ
jgi:predicted dehydrogenase